MKKILNLFLAITLILAMVSMPVSAEDNITIYVNEQMLQCDVAPYIHSRTFKAVAARVVGNAVAVLMAHIVAAVHAKGYIVVYREHEFRFGKITL